MKNVLSVGAGGILGSLARYYLYLPLNAQTIFPWGTLAVNLAGSFLLALFLTLALRHFYRKSLLVLAVSTGFTGSFTTFSAVSVEMAKLGPNHPLLTLLYVTSSFTAGLLLAFTGRWLGEKVSALIDVRLGIKEEGH